MVVLPEPCRPTIIQTDGGREANSGLACLPSMMVSSSRTVLTTCWSGDSWSMTSLPMVFWRMLASSSSATPTLTSPSSSASRISASAASRCSSVSLPWPRRFLNVRCSFSVRFSNIVRGSCPVFRDPRNCGAPQADHGVLSKNSRAKATIVSVEDRLCRAGWRIRPGKYPPLFFCKSVITKDFKTPYFVRVSFKGLTGGFLVRVSSKGLSRRTNELLG